MSYGTYAHVLISDRLKEIRSLDLVLVTEWLRRKGWKQDESAENAFIKCDDEGRDLVLAEVPNSDFVDFNLRVIEFIELILICENIEYVEFKKQLDRLDIGLSPAGGI